MNDLEKSRAQRDAQRIVSRRTSGTASEQAILSYLGVELYRDRRRTDPKPDEPDTGNTTDAPADH